MKTLPQLAPPTTDRHGIWGGKTPQQRYATYRSQTRKSKGENR